MRLYLQTYPKPVISTDQREWRNLSISQMLVLPKKRRGDAVRPRQRCLLPAQLTFLEVTPVKLWGL